MRAFRTMAAVALATAGIIWATTSAESHAFARDTEEKAAAPEQDAGPVPHATFSERGKRREMYLTGGGKRADTSVQLGLEWLKNHQNEDGRWDATDFSLECRINRCGDPSRAVGDVGVTGTALLAFLGACQTPAEGRYADWVTKGLEYLRTTQDAEGCFGDRASPTWLHDHMWAAYAMTEAYGMTGERRWKDSAYRAVGFVMAAQNPYLGWGPGVRDGVNDTTMTTLATSVLHAADAAELYDEALLVTSHKGAVAWVHKMTDPKTGRVGDVSRGGTGDPTVFPQLSGPALTAAGLLTRLQAGERPTSKAGWPEGRTLVREAGPRHSAVRVADGEPDETEPDYTLWFWGARAMFHAGGRDWRAWRAPLRDRLMALQWATKGRDERGSWDTGDDHASHGGRVFVTALACLALETPYREARITVVER
jgi:hypothetical protein